MMKAKSKLWLVPVVLAVAPQIQLAHASQAKKDGPGAHRAAFEACNDVLLMSQKDYDKIQDKKALAEQNGCAVAAAIPEINGVSDIKAKSEYMDFLEGIAQHTADIGKGNIEVMNSLKACFEDSKEGDASCQAKRKAFIEDQQAVATKLRVELALSGEGSGGSALDFQSHFNSKLKPWSLGMSNLFHDAPTMPSSEPLSERETELAKAQFEKDKAEILSQLGSKFSQASEKEKEKLFNDAYKKKMEMHRQNYLNTYYSEIKPLNFLEGAKWAQSDRTPSNSEVRASIDQLIKNAEKEVKISEKAKDSHQVEFHAVNFERFKRGFNAGDSRDLMDHLMIAPAVNDKLKQTKDPQQHAKECAIAQAMVDIYATDDKFRKYLYYNAAPGLLGLASGTAGLAAKGGELAESAGLGSRVAQRAGRFVALGSMAPGAMMIAQPIAGAFAEKREGEERFLSNTGSKDEKALTTSKDFEKAEDAIRESVVSNLAQVVGFGALGMSAPKVAHFITKAIEERMQGASSAARGVSSLGQASPETRTGLFALMMKLKDPKKLESAVSQSKGLTAAQRDAGLRELRYVRETHQRINESPLQEELIQVKREGASDEQVAQVEAMMAQVEEKTGKSDKALHEELNGVCKKK